MDLIDSIQNDKEFVLSSKDYESFIRSYRNGAYEGHLWIRNLYNSIKQHPDRYFAKPLLLPMVTKLSDLVTDIEVVKKSVGERYTPSGKVFLHANTQDFFKEDGWEGNKYITHYGRPTALLKNKYEDYFGAVPTDRWQMGSINIINWDKGDFLVTVEPENMIGGFWASLIRKEDTRGKDENSVPGASDRRRDQDHRSQGAPNH